MAQATSGTRRLLFLPSQVCASQELVVLLLRLFLPNFLVIAITYFWSILYNLMKYEFWRPKKGVSVNTRIIWKELVNHLLKKKKKLPSNEMWAKQL